MKFLAAGSMLTGMALADLQKMTNTFKNIYETSPNASLRALGDFSDDIFQDINGYGCWCYFGNDHGLGRASPVNAVDSLCKQLQDAYECILMDSQSEGDDDCVPWEVEYRSGTSYHFVGHDDPAPPLRKMCARQNRKNKCAERACMVENFFTVNLWKQLFADGEFDEEYRHNREKWSRADCVVEKGQGSTRECCGTYPVRFPYKVLGHSGARQCCGEHTFFSDVSECCAGNVVRAVGTC